MHKRDYEMIAEVIRPHVFLEWNNLNSYSISIVEGLADAFAEDNERFNREKFIGACVPYEYRS